MITKHDKFLVRHYSVLFEKKKLVGLHLGIFGVCCNVKSRWNRDQFYEDVLGLNHVLWRSYNISLSQVCLPNHTSEGSVVVSVLTSSAVDRGFETRSVPTKDYKIGICCFSFKHTTLRRKSKTGWLGIRIMCQSVATCLSTNCCFSELAL